MIEFKTIKDDSRLQELINHSIEVYASEMHRYREFRNYEKSLELSKVEVGDHFKYGVEQSHNHIFNIVNDEQVVGYVWFQMIVEHEGTAFLNYIYIDKEHRRHGYGEQSLKLFEQQVKEMGAKYSVFFVFKSNFPAVRMYLKHDYKIAKEVAMYEAKKTSRYKMVKML